MAISALNVMQLKHAAIAPSYIRLRTVRRREQKGSLPDAQFAKVPTQHGATPAQQERKKEIERVE
jgi:hypothetical protein